MTIDEINDKVEKKKSRLANIYNDKVKRKLGLSTEKPEFEDPQQPLPTGDERGDITPSEDGGKEVTPTKDEGEDASSLKNFILTEASWKTDVKENSMSLLKKNGGAMDTNPFYKDLCEKYGCKEPLARVLEVLLDDKEERFVLTPNSIYLRRREDLF
jgi:hypothetical protein